MLDLAYIRTHPNELKEKLLQKGSRIDIDRLLKVDEALRSAMAKLEAYQAEKNKANREMNKGGDRKDIIASMKQIDKKADDLKQEVRKLEAERNAMLRQLPNLALSDVPIGKDASENKVLREVGATTRFSFKPKSHDELGKALDLIDTKTAAHVSGTRFGYLKNEAALLEFGLVQLAFDTLLKKGFTPVIPPQLVKDENMEGLGYLEGQGRDERYHLDKDKLYFIGTAEHALIPMHAEQTLEAKDLPIRYAGFSTCFRREAGSYGKDTRGIFRVHQFDKVEMVSFSPPEQAESEFQLLLGAAEELMKKVEIPYRIVSLCTGDLSFPSARTYDIEAWIPSENRYRELQSISTCTDFQSRRLHIRFKTPKGLAFVHTLNGTAYAIGRTLIAILENHQQMDGSVVIPKALKKFVGIKKISPKNKI